MLQEGVRKYISLEHVFGPMNQEYIKHMLEHFAESYKNNGFGIWGVMDKETKKLIGWCGLHKVQLKDGEEIELAYTLDTDYWGKGLATEGCVAVKKYAFDVLNLPYIVSCIDPENKASINVAKKNGMQYWKDSEFFGKPCQVYRVLR